MSALRFRLATVVVLVFSSSVVTAGPAGATVPGEGIIRDAVGGTGSLAFDPLAAGVGRWVLGAAGELVAGVVDFLMSSTRPQLEALWFSGPASPFALVRNLAGVLLLGFVLLAVIQGLLAGDLGSAVGRIARDLCLAVLGMATTIVVSIKFLDLTDALSAAVLGGAGGGATRFISGFGAAAAATTGGFATVLIGLLVALAALFVWVELMVRSALIYLLVALAPLAFAAMTWPAARGVLRKTVELLVAVILSKFVIAMAIAVGAAALGGAGEGPNGPGTSTTVATGLGGLLSGGAILALAAFSPFLVLKLMPLAEAAMAAQGISRSPARGAQAAMSTVYYGQSLSRLAGRGGSNGNGASTSVDSAPPSRGPSNRGGSGLGGSGAGGPSPAGPASGGAGEGTATAAGAGAALATGTGRAAGATVRNRVAGQASSAQAEVRPPARPRPSVSRDVAGEKDGQS